MLALLDKEQWITILNDDSWGVGKVLDETLDDFEHHIPAEADSITVRLRIGPLAISEILENGLLPEDGLDKTIETLLRFLRCANDSTVTDEGSDTC